MTIKEKNLIKKYHEAFPEIELDDNLIIKVVKRIVYSHKRLEKLLDIVAKDRKAGKIV